MSDLRKALEDLAQQFEQDASVDDGSAYHRAASLLRARLAAHPEPAPRPVVDRELLRLQLHRRLLDVKPLPRTPQGIADAVVDAVLELARPMPTQEAIEQRIRRIYIDGGAHITHAQEAASEIAAAVLALINGENDS